MVAGLGAFYAERNREAERKILEVFKTSTQYVKACTDVHMLHSRVTVLAKTPGLILPTERDLAHERKEYFKKIEERLNQGQGGYELNYVFDLLGFRGSPWKLREG